MAEWLSRKLTAEGYYVWCEKLKLLGGEKYPDNIEEAINNQTFRLIALYSKASLQNQEIIRQRYLAMEVGKRLGVDFLIPINVDGISTSSLDRQSSAMVFIPFKSGWGNGLQQLLQKLTSIGCPKAITDGVHIAATAYFGEDIIERKPEDLYLNFFPILEMPKYLYVFESGKKILWDDLLELDLEWAYKKIGSRYYFAFHKPPEPIAIKYQIRDIDSIDWQKHEYIQKEYRAKDVLSELLKKELYVKCNRKGLLYCKETELHYFPADLVDGNWLKVLKPDGTKTRVFSTGKRTFPFPKEEYLYSIAPVFYVVNDMFDHPVVQLNVRVRISDLGSKPLVKKKRQSRRKHLCHDWWNEEWFVRTLAISQFLGDGDQIVLGEADEEKFRISTNPYSLKSPISINENVFDALMENRKRVKAIFGEAGIEDEEEYAAFYNEEDHE